MFSLNPTSFPCQSGLKREIPQPKRTVQHHVVPESWGGTSTPDNLINLCDNHHYGTHTLIDKWVSLNRPVNGVWGGFVVPPDSKGFDKTEKTLATRAVTEYKGTVWPGFTL